MKTESQKLEHMLRALRQDSRIAPSRTFRTNARIRLLNMVARSSRISHFSRPFFLFPGYALRAAFITVLVVGTITFMTTESLPGSPLFPLKVLGERVALSLSPTDELRTNVAASIIENRIHEIERVQKSGDTRAVIESYQNFTNQVESMEKTENISHDTLNETIQKHKNIIEEAEKDEHYPTPTVTPKDAPLVSPIPLNEQDNRDEDKHEGND